MLDEKQILCILQLASPALPVGSYSYSEGLESLTCSGIVKDAATLEDWLASNLKFGSIRLETVILSRVYSCFLQGDIDKLVYHDRWLSANRETRESRSQNRQMARSLLKLLQDLRTHPDILPEVDNYATAWAMAAVILEISLDTAVPAYLQAWAANLVNAGVRLIPLGQTAGQGVLFKLHPELLSTAREVLAMSGEEPSSWSWGTSLAGMQHETLYSRLFRS